jgi:hypothetical protein
MGKLIVLALISATLIASLPIISSASAETPKKPKEPYLVEGVFNDMSNDKTRPLWLEFKKSLYPLSSRKESANETINSGYFL